jgi:hypothetical protein
MMWWWFVIGLAVSVNVSTASVPLPRKVVLNADNLEILRLDIMSAEEKKNINATLLSLRSVHTSNKIK